MSSQANGHISSAFDAELNGIRERILRMGQLAQDQLQNLLEAIADFDFELARQIDSKDAELNRLELEVNDSCTEVLVRRSPTAGDLRFILVGIRFVADCERIGDESSRIARHLCRLKSADRLAPFMDCVRGMGERALGQVSSAMRGFREMNTVSAYEVFRLERKTDSAYHRHLAEVLSPGSKGMKARLFVFDALHAFERIGDHAVNIAEQVVYAVDGIELRHDYEPVEKPAVSSR